MNRLINIKTRLLTFVIIWFLYLMFMKLYSPLGIDWLSWHAQRVFNATEFLKINGYFSHFGFSIFTSCEDCSLEVKNMDGYVYLSRNLFVLSPYIFLNHFFGQDGLMLVGPLLDKIVILLSGMLLAEITLILFKKKNSIKENYFLSLIVFIFFIMNLWTYKMIIAPWYFVYFLFFFLLAIFFILKDKLNYFLISLFLSAIFDYQSAAGIIVFLLSYKLFSLINKKNSQNYFFTKKNKKILISKKIFLALFIPLLIHLIMRIFGELNLDQALGSSVLSRIGISGINNDIHNGGLVGALQFLFGNRITICHVNYNLQNLILESGKSENLILIYNCLLSLISMSLISILSIYGTIKLFINYNNFKIIIMPISFLLISYVCILQQSLSAHLMGYSFLFSPIFSLGIMYFFINIIKSENYSTSKMTIALPCFVGLIILSIRVSMLTGING